MPSGIWLSAYLALWALLLVESVVLIAVVRQVRILHAYWVSNEPDWGLPIGTLAPSLSGQDFSGRPTTLAAARGRKSLLFFLSPGCSSCRTALEYLDRIGVIEGLELTVVVTGSRLRFEMFAAEIRHKTPGMDVSIVADDDQQLMDQYNVSAVPYAVVVDEEGRIGAKGTVITDSEVETLMRQADERRAMALTEAGPTVDTVASETRDRETVRR